jgi:hypothetical protein
MLLLALLAILPTTAAAALNTSTVPCAPAPCGNLTIAYPFWLAGTHQPYCGYKAFQVACEDHEVYLKSSYWMYQVLDISYENSSFVVTNVNVQEYCDLALAGNASSSDLQGAAGAFKISSRNRGLFFLSDCQGQARQLPPPWAPVNCAAYDSPSSFAWLAGSYRPDDILKPLPGNCSVSLMPVLGYLGAVAADYDRLMKGGFLLEFNYTAEDCAPCTETGGKCSVDAGEDVLQCRCPHGVHTAAAACSEYRSYITLLCFPKVPLLFVC